jgi:glycine betaine/proline transport system substrate-binding protein
LASCSSSNNEKKISLTYVNWPRHCHDSSCKAIFEEQGYKVEMLNADVAPIFASLSRKEADVFLDTWLPVTQKIT